MHGKHIFIYMFLHPLDEWCFNIVFSALIETLWLCKCILHSDTKSQFSRDCFFMPLRRTIKSSGRAGRRQEDKTVKDNIKVKKK